MIVATEMFLAEEDKFFQLVYSAKNGMNAEEMGNAIIGMEQCTTEAIKILKLEGEYEVIVFPIEKGSQKTIFGILKKNREKIVVATASTVIPALIIGLVSGGVTLIGRIGANEAVNPSRQSFQEAQDLPSNVFELCKSKKFLEGSQKMTYPLKEEIQNVSIRYNNGVLSEINCDSKGKFFEDVEDEKKFPEWKDGDQIQIRGEITRMNKQQKSLGFLYQDATFDCHPDNKESTVMDWHYLMPEKQVNLTGVVKRESEFKKPEIKILNIQKIENSQTSFLSEENL